MVQFHALELITMYAMAFSNEVVSLESAIGGILLWADIGRNCNTFLGSSSNVADTVNRLLIS